MALRVGVSGWRYPQWRGGFYPKGLVQRQELAYASRAFSFIEINGSFYGLKRPENYASWFDETPDEFVFSVKAPRLVTHESRLDGVAPPLVNFFASGVLKLGQKLGPLLWQFPPWLAFEAPLFERFLEALPHDTEQALALARRHVQAQAASIALNAGEKRELRHAIEIRHKSFVDPAFVQLLRHHRVAFVVADTARKFPEHDDVTAGFVYVRLHGSTELYRSGYGDAELDCWAARIRRWSQGSQPEGARLMSPEPPPSHARATCTVISTTPTS